MTNVWLELDQDIRSLNLECIAYKACRDEGWTLEQVDQIEERYRYYLQMIRNEKGQEPIAPTRDVDVFWHHHILDTAKYMEDCQQLFGAYIHHFPYSGVFGGEDAHKQQTRVAATNRLIEKSLEYRR